MACFGVRLSANLQLSSMLRLEVLLQKFSYFPSSAFQLRLRPSVRDRVLEGLKSATKQKILNKRYSTEKKGNKKALSSEGFAI